VGVLAQLSGCASLQAQQGDGWFDRGVVRFGVCHGVLEKQKAPRHRPWGFWIGKESWVRSLAVVALLATQFSDNSGDNKTRKRLDGGSKDNGDHGFSWSGSESRRA
jgi:hypothetical protein